MFSLLAGCYGKFVGKECVFNNLQIVELDHASMELFLTKLHQMSSKALRFVWAWHTRKIWESSVTMMERNILLI
jgi:hypothetical protein